jgi:hypothetical protein
VWKLIHAKISGCALAYVIELWDLFTQVGVERKKPFVDVYSRFDRKDYVALAKWDREVNKGRVFKSWRKATHPQLGEVEVGGLDNRVGISNPPYEMIAKVCEQHSAAFLRVAALVPRVAIEKVSQERLGGGLTRIELRIANKGYLATYGLGSAKDLPLSEPLRLTTQGQGVEVTAPVESVLEIGHLQGWGSGLYAGANVFFPWTRGNPNERFVTLVVRGAGKLSVRVGSARVGYRALAIDV